MEKANIILKLTKKKEKGIMKQSGSTLLQHQRIYGWIIDITVTLNQLIVSLHHFSPRY